MTVATPASGWSVRANHYEWITDYLSERGATGAVRAVMAGVAVSFAICLVVLLRSVDGPPAGAPLIMMWMAIIGGLASAAVWVRSWPTRRRSVVIALLAMGSVALACLAYPDPQGALTGCIAFATTAAYIAFFHSTALVILNFVVAASVAVVAASRIAQSGHLALAAVDLFLVAQINIVMPVAIHLLVRALGADLERAGRDPLTGLLNRRLFQRRVPRMVHDRNVAPGDHLVVAMIDLDEFKRLNDTYGHQVGDDALVAVGRALRRAVADTPAVIARSGGEEFVVAAVYETADPRALARRVCEGIAALPMSVTASVGTASAPIRSLRRPSVHLGSYVESLVADADEAMYAAKRAGGNRHSHYSGH